MTKLLEVILGFLAGLLPGVSEARRKRRAEVRTALVPFNQRVEAIASGDWAGMGPGADVQDVLLKELEPILEHREKVEQVMDIDRRTAGVRWCDHVEDCLEKGDGLARHIACVGSPLSNMNLPYWHGRFENLQNDYRAAYPKVTR